MIERHEFQLRGAIHTHSLLWTLRTIDELIAEDYIRADLPDPILEPELHRLVQQHQIHNCTNQSCRLGQRDDEPCRKGFPVPLEPQTYQKEGELRYRYKRLKDADRWIVPYSPRILLLWQAHINVQYCTSAGLAKYISKYVTKSEPKGLYHIRTKDPLKTHLLGRRLGSMEIMMLLLSFPIFHMTTASM